MTLIDFGFTKKIEKEKYKRRKPNIICFRTSSFCGTIHAMAPEFFTEPVLYGYEIDYYSFGILFYELIVG